MKDFNHRMYIIMAGLFLLLILPVFFSLSNLRVRNQHIQQENNLVLQSETKSASEIVHINEWLNNSQVDEYFEGKLGDGTESNPYIIENVKVVSSDLIDYTTQWYIENVNRFIVFRNCTFVGVANDQENTAIKIRNSTNIKIEQCSFDQVFRGVILFAVNNSIITNCSFKNSSSIITFNLKRNADIQITNNNFTNTRISYNGFSFSSFSNNNVFGKNDIYIFNSYNSTISNNTFIYKDIPSIDSPNFEIGQGNITFSNNYISNESNWENYWEFFQINSDFFTFDHNMFNFSVSPMIKINGGSNIKIQENWFKLDQSNIEINENYVSDLSFIDNVWGFWPASTPTWQNISNVVFNKEIDL
ncbi:MAG: hypothetical protein ACTSX0_13240, partial [Promethearchaeota archaeon]